MAHAPARTAAALVLLAALPALVACGAPGPSTASTSGRLPDFGRPSPRLRAPSAERPPWLPSLPADLPRFPAPEGAFRA